jgi:hypothetical protein
MEGRNLVKPIFSLRFSLLAPLQLQRQADAKSPANGFKGLLEEVEKMNVKGV